MLKRSVTRALIPCGGKGTRMLGVTRGTAKELIDVAGIPALGRVIAECSESGIRELLIVVAPGKDAIVDYAASLAGTAGMPERIQFTEQPEPRGLADAIRLGRTFAEGEPLGVALPDNLFLGDEPALHQVIATHLETDLNVVGMVEIFASDAERRGPTAIYPGHLDGNVFRIERVPDKGARSARFDTGGALSAFTGIGRYVFARDAFGVMDDVERTLPTGAELDDIPVMQRLLAANRLVGRLIRGRFLDVGLPDGYAEANALLAARDSGRAY
jgi:UTP--glucose-1-phosphate uridylyltransferase